MKCLLLSFAVLICLVAPLPAQASGWHSYANKSLGFGLRYPTGWQVTVTSQMGQHLVVLSTRNRYSVQISVLPLTPGRNARQLARRVVNYQTSRGVTTFSRLHWTATRLGGRFADLAVVGSTTEVGVAVSQAFYLAPGVGRTYQIMMPVNSPKPLHSLQRFPVIYREIMSTWRFL